MPDARLGPLSIQARLTLWYCLVLLVLLSVCGVGVHVFLYRLGLARFDAELGRSTTLLADTIAKELEEELALSVAIDESLGDLPFPGRTVVVLDEADRPLASRADGVDAEQITRRGFPSAAFTVVTDAGSWRVRTRQTTQLDVTFRVVLAGPLAPIEAELTDLRRILLVGIPLALLLAAAGGRAIAHRGLAPLTRLATEAREMRDDRSGLRLSHPGTRDELASLTEEFNQLLGRLDEVLQGQRQFMADASHELRTPVSVIRNATEVTLSQPGRAVGEYADSLRVIGEQASRLTRIVDDLFLLARADAGGQPIQATRFYLDDLVEECLRGIALLAESRRVRLQSEVASDVEIEGDGDLVRRMVMNLLHNAIQHTPADGSLKVSLRCGPGNAEIAVHNDGQAIAAADRERIFERFVRLDASRQRGDSGGLGLPIARWIAEAHQGTLELAPGTEAGVTFIVRLPLATA